MNRKFKIYLAAGIGLAVCIVLVLLVFRHKSSSTEVKEGIEYVQEQETADVEAIEQTLKEQKAAHIQAECDEIIANLEKDGSDVWSLFDDYLLMGDSRAVGFWYYKYLPKENCPSEGGATIRGHLEEHLEDIYSKNPANLILCYGLNDVSIGYWDTPEEYVEEYKGVLEQIHEKVPDTKIFVSSILVARDPAFERSSKWRKIPDFNVAIQAMCNEMDFVWYVDNSGICDEYADLWNDDGIHVARKFYQYWATNIITEIYKSDMDTDSGIE